MKLIERTKCPICFNQKFKSLYKISYNSENLLNFLDEYYKKTVLTDLLKDDYYELLECDKCKLIFQKYIPDDEFSYMLYDEIISSEESLKKKLFSSKNLNLKYDNQIKLIKSIYNKKEIKVLEFGAGWGFWASRAIESGLNVDVFELSGSRVEYMKKKKINVIEDLKESLDQYDFIYSDQTIEHISDPHQIFKSFLPNLKKGGFILLGYPSSFMFKKKLKKSYIPKKDAAHPLEHINIFNRSSMVHLIKQYDLNLINFKSKFNPGFKNFLRDIKNLFYFDNILIRK